MGGGVRIASGRLRGRRVETPEGIGTRPLLIRLRKALVDILRPRLPGSRVLDLFAGSGAIAFELLSNGARAAVAVEVDRRAAGIVRANSRALKLDEVEVLEMDAIAAVRRLSARGDLFDVVVVAPPYGLDLQRRALAALASDLCLAEKGVVVVQREVREPGLVSAGPLRLARSRTYGRTVFDFYGRDGD